MTSEDIHDMMERGCSQGGCQNEHAKYVVETTSDKHGNPKQISGPSAENEDPRSKTRWLGACASRLRKSIRRDKKTCVEEDPFQVRSLESCPEGYPRLAAFLDSDEHFMLYRRFGYLQTRIILYKQDQLRALESKLDFIDQRDGEDSTIHRSRHGGDVCSENRKELMSELEGRFGEYTKLLINAKSCAGFDVPLDRDYTTIMKYFQSELPLCHTDSYIYQREDIITLLPDRDTTWLDAFIESIFQAMAGTVMNYICIPKRLRGKVDPKSGITMYSRRRVDVVVTLMILTMITCLFIIPVYIIWRLTRDTEAAYPLTVPILVMLLFTLAFSLVLLKFTKARRHEILAAAAGYCAVLVTFMGNVGQFGNLEELLDQF